MPDSGLYGAPAGSIAASNQIETEQANNLSLATGKVALQKAQVDLAAQEKMMKMMSGGGAAGQNASGGTAGGTADMLDTLAGYAAAAGLPEEVKQYASTASTIRRNQAYITTQTLNKQIKESGTYANLLDDVHDPQSWQRANALFAVQTGRQSPFAKLPYNPKIVQALKEGAISAKDKATIAASRARELASDAQVKVDNERIKLLKIQETETQARADHLNKIGGGKPPTAQNLSAITDLVVRDFGKQVPMETVRTLARPVAERMDEILRTSPGLQRSQAAERAYQEAKAEGDFGGLRKMPSQRGTRENPLPLPQDQSKWQPNLYYTLPNGEVRLWNGKGFPPTEGGL
jgi:hypothetical protein